MADEPLVLGIETSCDETGVGVEGGVPHDPLPQDAPVGASGRSGSARTSQVVSAPRHVVARRSPRCTVAVMGRPAPPQRPPVAQAAPGPDAA
ncbi:hypothetical protein SALBM311S_05651 [Streptomyces alboniger]